MPTLPPAWHDRQPLASDEKICWCFGYRVADLIADYRAHNGRSSILERLIAEKRAGSCDCARKNPKGR